MSAFGKYFGRLLKVIFEDIGAFFKLIWEFIVSVWRNLISDFSYYKSVFDLYSEDFDFLGWILFILSILVAVALVAGAVY